MADDNNKNPNEKQPGENLDGKYHFNPGNMAGKKPGDPGADCRKPWRAAARGQRKTRRLNAGPRRCEVGPL